MIDLGKKVLLLPLVFSLLMFTIDYIVDIVKNNINLGFFDLIYYLGLAQALQVLVSFAVLGFVANHMLNYFKNL